MRLDLAQLPKAFQVNALTSREWTLESDWKKFPFRADVAGAGTADGLTVGPAGTPGAAQK